jgi:hypothetical protein
MNSTDLDPYDDDEFDGCCSYCGELLDHDGRYCDDTCREREDWAFVAAIRNSPTLSDDERADLLRPLGEAGIA